MDLTELQEIEDHEREHRKPTRIRCCISAGCQASGALDIQRTLSEEVERCGLADEVGVAGVGCLGLCGHGHWSRSTQVATSTSG